MSTTWSAERSILERIVAPAGRAERVLHVEHVPPRQARTVDWPSWAHRWWSTGCARGE